MNRNQATQPFVSTSSEPIVRPLFAVNLAPGQLAARDDLAFCLPLTISLSHTDYARLVLAGLHAATFAILAFLPEAVLICVGMILICSLKLSLSNQTRLNDWSRLRCDHRGQWRLDTESGERAWTRLVGLRMLGPLCVVELRCFGSPVYWITWRWRQSEATWTRLRVMARYL